MIADQNLRAFLLDAKRNTYAAQGDEATVANSLLPGGKQLEWRSGNLLYRDIYFGMGYFTGQETVYWENLPVWAMCYSGGVIGESGQHEIQRVYSFLREALRLVPGEQPFRGPREFASGAFIYQTDVNGTIERFEGREEIFVNESLRYALIFAGGRVV